MRHDDESRLFAYDARKVFDVVEVEPRLQPIEGEKFKYKSANKKHDARSDVRVRGFWSRQRNTFFDFNVFYPFARSYRSQNPSKLYKLAADIKRREYAQRIANVENADFTPMIMSTSGGMGTQMSSAIRRLALKIAEKRNETYSTVVCILRTKFVFNMLRSALVCLRGSRSLKPRKKNFDSILSLDTPATVVLHEARLR